MINLFEKLSKDFISAKPINENKLLIKSNAKYISGKSFEIYLEREGSKLYFTDSKATIKYLNELYELKSSDVRSCIANILKLYNVKMISGELIIDIHNEKLIQEKYFNFVMCINQLANMFVFFDKPE